MDFLDQKDLDVDVYFSTWNKTTLYNPDINGSNQKNSAKRIVSLREIQAVLNIPASIKIHNFDSHCNNPYIAMRKGWILGFNMIKESNIKYDYVYVLRPDLFFRSNALLDQSKFTEFKTQVGFTYLPSTDPILNNLNIDDTSFFSTYENIEKIINEGTFDLDQKYGGWHHVFYEYVASKGLTFGIIPLKDPGNLIGRYPMNRNSTWREVDTRYWNLFHNRDE